MGERGQEHSKLHLLCGSSKQPVVPGSETPKKQLFLPGGSLQKHPKPLKPKAASCRYFKMSQLLAGEQGELLKGRAGSGPQQLGVRMGLGIMSGKQSRFEFTSRVRSNNRRKTSLCKMLLFHYVARQSLVLFCSCPVTSSLALSPEE